MSRPSIRSSSASVFVRCVPVAIRIVTSARRTCGSSSKMARSVSLPRLCPGDVAHRDDHALAGLDHADSGALSMGWRRACSSAPCTSAAAGRNTGSITVTPVSGSSTSRPLVP